MPLRSRARPALAPVAALALALLAAGRRSNTASQPRCGRCTVARHRAGRSRAYYSPLNAINDHNVATLGLAWEFKTGTSRGLEATPLVVDGVMYTSGNWGMVYALDAATGKSLWTFDPKIDRQVGRFVCCDVVNRGVVVAAAGCMSQPSTASSLR